MEGAGLKTNDEEYSRHNIVREDKGEYDVLCNYANNVFCIDFEKKSIEEMCSNFKDYLSQRENIPQESFFKNLLNKLF